MNAVMKEVKMGMGSMGARFLEEVRESRISGLLYADDLISCDKLEENFRTMVGHCVY